MTSVLVREVWSQPEVVARLLTAEWDHIADITRRLPACEYAYIAARGSSDHAALYATYAWAALAGYPVSLATPSLHTLYQAAPRLTGALVVGISQSGQSPDIIAVLREGKRQGRPTLAITNDAASPLAAAADAVVALQAGREVSVAATKTYTAELSVIAAFAAHWSGDAGRLAELRRLPGVLQATLDRAADVPALAARYRDMTECIVVGRGYNYATAYELALKIQELAYVMATAYSSADFRHGPIAAVGAGLPVILVMPGGAVYDDMLALAHDLRARGAELLVISDVEEAQSLATTALALPGPIPEWLSPIAAIVPGQVFALQLALAKGLDPDAPRGLQKVTRTT